MGNFNKVLSFILGLVVVIVFVIVLSKRLNLQSKFIPFGNNPTPTPKVKEVKEIVKKEPEIKFTEPTEINTEEVVVNNENTNVKNIQSIPETGPSTSLLYAYSTLGALGIFLRRFKK